MVGIKGRHGIIFNKILTWAEQQGDAIIIDIALEKLEAAVPKIWEYNRAIHASLKTWTDGEAKRFIKYEVNGGIVAWRKFYMEYIPLAQTRQDIILSEVLEMKPVTIKDVRKKLNRMEESRYKYNQCGNAPLGDNLIKRMLVTCIPKEVMKPLVLHLESAETFQQARKLIMRQMHDELTGMLEGEATQPLYSIGQDSPKKEDQKDEEQDKTEEGWQKLEQEYFAALKGKVGKGGKRRKGKQRKRQGVRRVLELRTAGPSVERVSSAGQVAWRSGTSARHHSSIQRKREVQRKRSHRKLERKRLDGKWKRKWKAKSQRGNGLIVQCSLAWRWRRRSRGLRRLLLLRPWIQLCSHKQPQQPPANHALFDDAYQK